MIMSVCWLIVAQFLLISSEIVVTEELDCTDGVLFSILTSSDVIEDLPQQGQADETCQNFSYDALATIRSKDEFRRAFAFQAFTDINNANRGLWVGLFDDGTSGKEQNDPTRFAFTDGTETGEDEFFSTFGELPWRSDRPSNRNERCVFMNRFGNFDDSQCTELRNVLCRTSCENGVASATGPPEIEPTRNSLKVSLIFSILGFMGLTGTTVLLFFQSRNIFHLTKVVKSHKNSAQILN